jgi:hypothetical protein
MFVLIERASESEYGTESIDAELSSFIDVFEGFIENEQEDLKNEIVEVIKTEIKTRLTWEDTFPERFESFILNLGFQKDSKMIKILNESKIEMENEED